jgi:hypothetical protein
MNSENAKHYDTHAHLIFCPKHLSSLLPIAKPLFHKTLLVNKTNERFSYCKHPPMVRVDSVQLLSLRSASATLASSSTRSFSSSGTAFTLVFSAALLATTHARLRLGLELDCTWVQTIPWTALVGLRAATATPSTSTVAAPADLRSSRTLRDVDLRLGLNLLRLLLRLLL